MYVYSAKISHEVTQVSLYSAKVIINWQDVYCIERHSVRLPPYIVSMTHFTINKRLAFVSNHCSKIKWEALWIIISATLTVIIAVSLFVSLSFNFWSRWVTKPHYSRYCRHKSLFQAILKCQKPVLISKLFSSFLLYTSTNTHLLDYLYI